MATYKVKAPDGRVLTLQGPEGASPQEVISQAQRLYTPSAAQIQPIGTEDLEVQSQPLPVQMPQPLQNPFAGPPIAPETVIPSVAPNATIQPSQVIPGAPTVVRPRDQLFETSVGPFQPKSDLGNIALDALANTGETSANFTGGVYDAAANTIQGFLDSAKFNLTRLFVGDDALNKRAADIRSAPGYEDTIKAPEINPVSKLLQQEADKNFAIANEVAKLRAENPIDQSKLVTFDSVQSDPFDLSNTGRFIVENMVASAPDMAVAAIPIIGPAAFGGIQTQRIAEDNAENRGVNKRDIQGKDLANAIPYATASAALEKTGIEGLAATGKTAVSRIAKSAAIEGATEAAQEPIEYAGEVAGTDKPFSTEEAIKRSQSGALVGSSMGGGIKTGGEVAGATKRAVFGSDALPPETKSSDGATDQASAAPNEQPKLAASDVPAQPQVTPVKATEPQVTETPQNVTKTKKVVTPDGSMEIDTQDEVVEYDSLQKASGDLQPRDRTRTTSDMQIQKIANELDPERLGDSRTTDQGAPIVGPDNQVESGNGRIAAISKAYEINGEPAKRYRQSLISKGYNIDGMKRPVLIRRRTTDLTPEDRVKFASLSNKSQISEMSSTEKAANDARQIDDGMIDLYQGGSPDSVDNQDFSRAFIQKVATGNEAGSLIGKDMRLTQDGVKRIQAAIVSKAYDNSDLVENLFESSDPEVKAIGNVLKERAPEYAQLGAAVRRGDVPKRFDIAKNIMDAVKIIKNSRRDAVSIRDILDGTKQMSMIDEEKIDPVTEKIIRSMYRPGLGRMLSQSSIDKVLNQYASLAKEQKSSDLFGENKTEPVELIDRAYQKATADLEPKEASQGQGALQLADLEDSSAGESKQPDNQSRAGPSRVTQGNPEEAAKTSGRQFPDFSTNKEVTKYRTAYVDLGIDPDIAVNKPADEQLNILSSAISNRFGVKVDINKKMDRRGALDMLHNIYNNLSFISGVFGLPYKAIGLNGTLTLHISEKLKALGLYDPESKTILLPKGSNSFIHEWLHALDNHLLDQFAGVQQGTLFSEVVKKNGVIDPSDSVQSAFAHLLNVVFYDKAMLASIKMDLDKKLESAKTDSERSDIQAKIKQIENGNYRGIKGKSSYYKSSQQFGNGSGYWTTPEEMLARVFEAYTAYKIDQAGGDHTNIAKGDLAYLSNVDERLEKTFPKLRDRANIFEAVDQLMSRLRERAILGGDINKDAPMKLEDFSILDVSKWGDMSGQNKKYGGVISSLIKEQVDNIDNWRTMVSQLYAKMKEQKEVEKKFPKSKKSTAMWLYNLAFSADRATMHSLEKKYPAAAALRQLNNRVFTRLGYGDEVVKREYFDSVRIPTTRFKNMIAQVKNKLGKVSEKELENIRDIMVSLKKDGTEKERQAAGYLRNLFDKMYAELKNAGVEIGYLRDQGYLSRMYVKRKILAQQEKFIEQAAKGYGIQFDQNVGQIINDIIESPELFIQYLKKMLREAPERLSVNKKRAQEIIEALSQDEVTDDVANDLEGILQDVRQYYSQTAAEDWFSRILNGSEKDEFGSDAGSAGFTKKRTLPPEMDELMRDFMETDPFIIADHYSQIAGRRIGLATAKGSIQGKTYEQLMKELPDQGVSKGDIETIRKIYDQLYRDAGQDDSSGAQAARTVIGGIRLLGTLTLLDLAAAASLAERFTVIIKTKNVSDNFKVLYYTIDQILRTKSAKEAEFALQQMGVLFQNHYENDVVNSRLGGGEQDPAIIEYIGNQFFAKNGLTLIDNSSRKVVGRISLAHFKRVSDILLNPRSSKSDKDFASQDLKLYGIAPEDQAGFAMWINGKGEFKDVSFANVNDWIDTKYGRDLMWAINRFNNQTIQRPTAADTPHYSKSTLGTLLYAVTRFSYSFWENVVKAEATRLSHGYKTHGLAVGAYQTALLAVSIAPLFIASSAINTLRVALFDSEKWEDLEDKDEQLSYIMRRTVSSTGVLGPVADLVYNTWTGVRYQRDIATSLSGAYLSSYLKWAESMFALFGPANTSTNTREYNAIKESWKGFVAPSIAATLAVMPGGKILSPLEGLGIVGIGSSTLADQVATSIVGPKGEKPGGKSKGEPKEPKEAGERKAKGD